MKKIKDAVTLGILFGAAYFIAAMLGIGGLIPIALIALVLYVLVSYGKNKFLK